MCLYVRGDRMGSFEFLSSFVILEAPFVTMNCPTIRCSFVGNAGGRNLKSACTPFIRLGRGARQGLLSPLLLYPNKFVNSRIQTSFANGPGWPLLLNLYEMLDCAWSLLCTTPWGHMGECRQAITPFLIRWGLEISLTLRLLYPQEMGFLYSLNWRLGGPQNRSGTIRRRENTPARNWTMISWSFSPCRIHCLVYWLMCPGTYDTYGNGLWGSECVK
jgi:hypothetical protein